LDQKNLQEIASRNPQLVIFTDLGSGMLDAIKSLKLNAVIADHHQPQGKHEFHLNPHLFGLNGGIEVSGSGMAYFIARE
ncbi:MAG: recombinase RecJ, partial [Candidatus Methanoperedens sp.]|nr:recombinase RecJ [Candidatus Methanoperedens sp.]